MNTEIVIRPVCNAGERRAAIEYISKNMLAKNGGFPPPEKTPKYILIALEGSTIVGSVAVQCGEKNAPLPIEEFFDFNPTLLPFPFIRERTAYLTRWNSSRRGLGVAIWLGGSLYAVKQGCLYSSLTIKDSLFERDKQFARIWHSIPDARVRVEHVGDTEKKYFLGASPPRPWIGLLSDQIRDLSTIVEGIRQNIPVTFDI